MEHERVFEDLFNMMCGEKLGEGVSRSTYVYKLDPSLVVKVEFGDRPQFQNVLEFNVWASVQGKAASRWFAPCELLSPGGRILIQKRTTPAEPSTLLRLRNAPSYLCDFKPSNYGMLKGKLVCHDYGLFYPLGAAFESKIKRPVSWVGVA